MWQTFSAEMADMRGPTTATSSRQTGKSVPRLARVKKNNGIELASLRQRFRPTSLQILFGKVNTKMWKSIARICYIHRDAEELQHSPPSIFKNQEGITNKNI